MRNSLALGTSPIVRALIDPEGGMADVRKLDSISFADWFRGHGGNQAAIDRMWDPIGARPGYRILGVQVLQTTAGSAAVFRGGKLAAIAHMWDSISVGAAACRTLQPRCCVLLVPAASVAGWQALAGCRTVIACIAYAAPRAACAQWAGQPLPEHHSAAALVVYFATSR